LRIDLARIRAAIGESAFEILKQGSHPAAGSSDPDALLGEAISRADTVWIALRPSERGDATDSVTVLKGRFAELDPRRLAKGEWGPPTDLGADWRRFERKRPVSRARPARIYARSDDLLVFVTPAALDSVERRLERGIADEHLDPTEKGVFSVDARPAPLARLVSGRSPTIGRLLARSERLKVTADLDAQGLRGELELELPGESEAREAAESLGSVARALVASGGMAAKLAAGLVVEAVGSRAVVHVRIPPETLALALRCAGGGACE
jgi:hypothetical protein